MGHSYLVIGCGVFGLTTALQLSQDDATCQITLLDRYEPPVPDGASVDSSRIIRADYADPIYAALARRAQTHWRTDPELRGAYHESGMLLNTAASKIEPGYLDKCIANVKALGIDVMELEGDAVLECLLGMSQVPVESRGLGLRGYLNPVSGFADSRMGIEILYARAKTRSNIQFEIGQVTELLYNESITKKRRVVGATTGSGRAYHAETTILATGAWQLPDVPVPSMATGQVIGYIDLSPDEVEKYGKMPVTIDFSTGWFCIPPYQGHLKVARHAEGYLNTVEVTTKDGGSRLLSVPRTSMTHGKQDIPLEGEQALREGLRIYLPELADRPFSSSRVCWYTDTPTSDFIIDWHPHLEGLFLATGGSGHGYKFLPILGELIVSVLNNTTEASLRKKWSFVEASVAYEAGVKGDGSRGKGARLEWSTLC